MTETLAEKLDRLANFQAERTVLELEKKELIDQVLTPEIKARLAEIEAEFLMKSEAVDDNISVLESEIRSAVLRHGASVKGEFLPRCGTRAASPGIPAPWTITPSPTRTCCAFAARESPTSPLPRQGEREGAWLALPGWLNHQFRLQPHRRVAENDIAAEILVGSPDIGVLHGDCFRVFQLVQQPVAAGERLVGIQRRPAKNLHGMSHGYAIQDGLKRCLEIAGIRPHARPAV